MSLADSDNDGTYSEEELNGLTKAQLASLASELGIEGVNSSQTKAVMVETILASL